jgi:hypothetical protein
MYVQVGKLMIIESITSRFLRSMRSCERSETSKDPRKEVERASKILV